MFVPFVTKNMTFNRCFFQGLYPSKYNYPSSIYRVPIFQDSIIPKIPALVFLLHFGPKNCIQRQYIGPNFLGFDHLKNFMHSSMFLPFVTKNVTFNRCFFERWCLLEYNNSSSIYRIPIFFCNSVPKIYNQHQYIGHNFKNSIITKISCTRFVPFVTKNVTFNRCFFEK